MEEVLAAAIVLSGVATGNAWLLLLGILILLFLLGGGLGYYVLHKRGMRHAVRRAAENPVLAPISAHDWESQAVFNPAAIYDGTRVHLLYRALGNDGISRIGYASSRDGIHFDERLPYPVFVPNLIETDSKFRNPFTSPARRYDRALYSSGGGWGGSEDPRLVEIDGTVYMTYSVFDGWQSIRIAVTSIAQNLFKTKQWQWKKPAFLSPPNKVNKNWVLFPEKINGKFAILNAVSPKIQIAYVDNLDEIEKIGFINSEYVRDPEGRTGVWDSSVRGAGAPPLKTNKGWLLFYHGIDKYNDPDRYKVGAMLLDLEDPTKVLYRSDEPVLEPDMPYENDWKPGVVYASGAVIKNGELFLYYGGGDRTVNVATAPLGHFLYELVHHAQPRLKPVPVRATR